jgi:TPR repeat protein
MIFKSLMRILGAAVVMACLATASAQAGAVEDTRAAAEQGDATAQFALGVMYATGLGVPQDHAEAVNWYRLAAVQGMACMATASAQEGAVEDVRALAEQGDAQAQSNLGVKYEVGDGVLQDHAAAVKWYRVAAEQGYAPAQNNLGLKYDKGLGVLQDHAAAVKWYRRAAEQGDADAQFNLGRMYFSGKGVPQDYILAHKSLNLAAAQGNKFAMQLRDFAEGPMTGEQIAEAQQMARAWKPKPE